MKVIRDSNKEIVAFRHWNSWYIDKQMFARMRKHESPLSKFTLYFEKLESESKLKALFKQKKESIREKLERNDTRGIGEQVQQPTTSNKGRKTTVHKK